MFPCKERKLVTLLKHIREKNNNVEPVRLVHWKIDGGRLGKKKHEGNYEFLFLEKKIDLVIFFSRDPFFLWISVFVLEK